MARYLFENKMLIIILYFFTLDKMFCIFSNSKYCFGFLKIGSVSVTMAKQILLQICCILHFFAPVTWLLLFTRKRQEKDKNARDNRRTRMPETREGQESQTKDKNKKAGDK